jgi:hypothetical protein
MTKNHETNELHALQSCWKAGKQASNANKSAIEEDAISEEWSQKGSRRAHVVDMYFSAVVWSEDTQGFMRCK